MRQNLMLFATCLCLCPLFGCGNSNSSQSSNAAPQGNIASTTPTPKKDTKHFVNPCPPSPCIKFSFDYPEGWVLRDGFANISDDSRYAAIKRDSSESYNIGDFPEDKFDYIQISGGQSYKTMEEAKSAGSLELIVLSPEYKRISKGEIRVGSYDAYQTTVSHPKAGTDRTIYLPYPDGGLSIHIHDAPSAPEMKGVDDPSKMGRFNVILNSLKIGS